MRHNPRNLIEVLEPRKLLSDAYEPNNTLAAATDLGVVQRRVESALTIDNYDTDWFRVTAAGAGRLVTQVNFPTPPGALELDLYDASGTALSRVYSPGASERATADIPAAGGVFYISVQAPYGFAANPNYQLLVSTSPVVSSASFDSSAASRLRFAFSSSVSGLEASDVLLQNLDTGAIVSCNWGIAYDAATQSATFTAGSPLPDGNYRATLRGTGLSDAAGNPLAEDSTLDFSVLAADANGDAAVDTLDFNALAGNFGQSGHNRAEGDFNGDAVVDTLDFNALAASFGQALDALPLRVSAGGFGLRDSSHQQFQPPSFFTGGSPAFASPYDVQGTDDDALFYSYRTGSSFSFARPLRNGRYAMWLEFAEPDGSAVAGQRVFDVFAEGTRILDDYDVAADVGVHTAVARFFELTVTDGRLDVSFSASAGEAILSAIALIPQDVNAAALPYSGIGDYTDPVKHDAVRTAWLTLSASNLLQIGQGLLSWANAHKAYLPPDLGGIVTERYITEIGVFANPRVPRLIPRGEVSPLETLGFVDDQRDYIFALPGRRIVGLPYATTILAYENPDTVPGDRLNVLYLDGRE
jgi:hypothetical protein